jgi:hypothetical protein
MDVDLAKLGRFIADHYDLRQLEGLCRELGIAYEQLVGDTRSAKAFDLVTLVRDRGQLSQLLAAVTRAHPDTFDARSLDSRQRRERTGYRRWSWLAGLVAGLAVTLVIGFLLLRIGRQTPGASPGPAAGPTSAQVQVTVAPTPTKVPVTPTGIPATPTPRPTVPLAPSVTPTSSPTPTPTARPRDTSTPTPSPTPSPTGTPSPTPELSPLSAALDYDQERGILTLAPGDASLGRARLCTPLLVYHSTEAVYLLQGVVDALGLPLPAMGRVVHSCPERLGDEPVVRSLEIRPHPVEGATVSGDVLNFIGCDLILSAEVRELLGFPLTLGAFNDPARFDHGWVTIEFSVAP